MRALQQMNFNCSTICRSSLRAAPSRLFRPAARRLSVPSRSVNFSEEFGDHSWRQQNHIWDEAEIAQRMKTADLKHMPQGLAESALQKLVRGLYHSFNWATGYEHADPSASMSKVPLSCGHYCSLVCRMTMYVWGSSERGGYGPLRSPEYTAPPHAGPPAPSATA